MAFSAKMPSIKAPTVKQPKIPAVKMAKMPVIKDPKAKYQGKGTRARLNTAANKMFFNTKAS